MNEMILSAESPTFPISAAAIEERRAKCLAMKVDGIADVEGFKIADRARMDIKADRCAVQNRAKDLKKQVKDWTTKNVDEPAEKIIGQLAEIETYLESQTEPVKLEKERLAREAEEKKKREAEEKLAARTAALMECRAVVNPLDIARWLDEEFADQLAKFQAANKVRRDEEAELERLREQQQQQQREAAPVTPPTATATQAAPVVVDQKPSATSWPQWPCDVESDCDRLLSFAIALDSSPILNSISPSLRPALSRILNEAADKIRLMAESIPQFEQSVASVDPLDNI